MPSEVGIIAPYSCVLSLQLMTSDKEDFERNVVGIAQGSETSLCRSASRPLPRARKTPGIAELGPRDCRHGLRNGDCDYTNPEHSWEVK